MPYPYFKIDALNTFVAWAIGLFSLLTLIYSFKYMKARRGVWEYYAYLILTAGASVLAVLANNLILLLSLWGFLGLTLYLLINFGEGTRDIAKKTFIIVGGSDALMLFGIAIIYYLTGTFQMDKIKISLSLPTNSYLLPTIAYICLAIACFAKAGAMPFHSWIPDCAKYAPAPVVAFLPASLDKLLGIYLLARISLDLFSLNQAMNILLMLIGAFTIIAAVMMALVQEESRRLLGYLTIASAGYMLLALGIANPVGIAGGLFYMLNSAICNSCLFFCIGNIISKTKSSELNELGGLSKLMPLTYIACLIASLSISGVPPFNGFFSKWMIYQGVIEQFQAASFGMRVTAIFCLAAAMFGSALTLASFMKLLHAIFLGQGKSRGTEIVKEVSWLMWLPCIILAIICALFGIFAGQVPLKFFILPAVSGVSYSGTWLSGLSTLLIIAGLILGGIIFKLKPIKPLFRKDTAFIGAEPLDLNQDRVSGTQFYDTVRQVGILKSIYDKAQDGLFDIYDVLKRIVFSIGGFFQFLHNGKLPSYLVWTLLGMMGLFWALAR